MSETGTLSSFDRSYMITRMKREARGMRLEAARAASVLADQLTSLAAKIEAEATALEVNLEEEIQAWRAYP